jgi:hypothetical protein
MDSILGGENTKMLVVCCIFVWSLGGPKFKGSGKYEQKFCTRFEFGRALYPRLAPSPSPCDGGGGCGGDLQAHVCTCRLMGEASPIAHQSPT